MHHLYPSLKGDQLCPLGFHPQTRYPTRCKRCFRDYKEHGARRAGEEVAASSPNLSDAQNSRPTSRTWTSTQNLTSANSTNGNDIVVHFNVELRKRPQSWASTPDIDEPDDVGRRPQAPASTSRATVAEDHNVAVTVKLPVPPRRHTTALDIKEVEHALTTPSRVTSSPSKTSSIPDELVILSTDSLAERVRKMNLLKKQRSLNSRENSRERSVPRREEESESTAAPAPPVVPDRPERSKSGSSLNQLPQAELKRAALPPKKVAVATTTTSSSSSGTTSLKTSTSSSVSSEMKATSSSSSSSTSSSSVRRKEADAVTVSKEIKRQTVPAASSSQSNSISTSSKTADSLAMQEQMKTLRQDLETMKSRAEKAEREKSDILLRRLASMDTSSNRTAASEALNLQQKLNEMKEQLDRVTEDKRRLNLRMKELENKGSESELRRKLQAAEQICEELMEENQSAKKEILNLQAEMDEVQDTFRDDEVKAKTSLQKDLEKATKNCRILSFKLKKSDRKIETLEQERQSSFNAELCNKVKKLEEELRFSNELTRKLQAEAEELRNPGKKKAPMLGVLGKSTSADAKITRESLTRGGSQEDPQHLQRELQDSIERETDLKDQLKFAEEELQRLRDRERKRVRFSCGTQTSTEMPPEILAFPRGTQTVTPNQRDISTSVENLVTSSEADTQTDLETIDRNASTEREIMQSPFVGLFPPSSSSRVGQSGSLLFPSAISHVLLSGAGRKLSPTPHPHRLAPEVHADRDEGISDEDDPAELRILLELNEQEASILRLKVEDLEKENAESKKYMRELQAKLRQDSSSNGSKSSLLSFGTSSSAAEKKLKTLNEELVQLRLTLAEKEQAVDSLKDQLSKLDTLETENDKLAKENKRLLALRKASEKTGEVDQKMKESLAVAQRERDELTARLKRMQLEAEAKLPARTAKRVNDLTPKSHLKKWVEELEDEISEMRVMLSSSGTDQLKALQAAKGTLEEDLRKCKQKLTLAEGDVQRLKLLNGSNSKVSDLEQKLKRSDEDTKKLNSKLKDLEEKVKKQEAQLKLGETSKSSWEAQSKKEKEKLSSLEKDIEKQSKEKEKLEAKITQLDVDLLSAKKSAEKSKASLEKEIKDLKAKASKSDSKQVQDLKNQVEEVQASLSSEQKRYEDLNNHWEKLSEETILMRAQLTTEKQTLQAELNAQKQKISEMDTIRIERTDMARKLSEAQKKIADLQAKALKAVNGNGGEYERTVLKNKLAEKEHEYERLRRENEMNIDLVFQLRKDNDDLNGKLSDYNRIEQAQSSLNGHGARREAEIRELKEQLQSTELQMKSEVATVRLRYEQQVKNLSGELNSMQRQCERFKKDRDAFKQMLEVAQKKIGDLKANNTGRQSRGSMHSSDDDDKSKIAYLEQQIGNLEDQLVESRLESSKIKTELVSERSANEIKISEMQSKLNEFEEERVIGSGSTKLPGMKTKLELSWQKEREDQQRLLQETSTLARDLRQTLFEVERERDKERLESKRKLDQIKRATEEEMEEGRKKIAELQCDLLELRDVHAKLRTSNEKLRRERERYEKELIKRRMEADGGDRKVGALLQTVDELVKIAPDLKMVGSGGSARSSSSSGYDKNLRPEQPNVRRSRSPSPTLSSSQITSVLARLAEASEELRKFQRVNEDEQERSRMRRSNLRRAASQENDPHGSTSSVASAAGSQRGGGRLSRNSSNNGSLIRKSLSLDHSIQRDQNIWRQDDGSVSSMQSIDSELGGLVRDSSLDSRLDSRLSGGSTQSDIPRGPRKKKKGIMGKLRSLTKSSRNSESEISIQGSDSDISVASDLRSSKKDLRGRLSGMFKRSGSNSRSESMERAGTEHRPVAVTVVGHPDGPQPREPPPANSLTPRPIRSIPKPPSGGAPTTPTTRRRVAK
ncbi:myosin-2 heavy chain isoform X1 [Drosophila subpulchrella]|uniref:myosin-2 heavy chain isoform X1 n=1 Tax=Drosophila subpulchrella TaxID=1486046 RepID=UPI0018A1B4E4|nr:myosin-2 heavy chain isoform X1 [Drosophila subpulchrella]XP_037707795.1 myosin-2 heavy chain isoform X1 [Drosophila subpulchrella]XP_037707796.1 myosin-2 heavy chain isoform X1 [Drosophila subpulchrella]